MAGYNTANYNYTTGTADLARRKGLEDVAGDYGRFMSQERHRRTSQDAGDQFRRNMPRVGSAFNRRGIYNSGLRQQGQNDFVKNYQQQVSRNLFDQAGDEQKFQLERTASDSNYQAALLDLFDRLQVARSAGYDPFAANRSA